VLAGGLTYLVLIVLMARSLLWQVLELISSVLPGRMSGRFRRTPKKLDERLES
jgi:hypothetical protein